MVGWGADGGIDYWTVANSWGTGWGESGIYCVTYDHYTAVCAPGRIHPTDVTCAAYVFKSVFCAPALHELTIHVSHTHCVTCTHYETKATRCIRRNTGALFEHVFHICARAYTCLCTCLRPCLYTYVSVRMCTAICIYRSMRMKLCLHTQATVASDAAPTRLASSKRLSAYRWDTR